MSIFGRLATYLARPDLRLDPWRLLARRAIFEVERAAFPERLCADRVIRMDKDLSMSLRLTDTVSRSIYLYGFHEFRMAKMLSELVRDGMVVVDAGAHVGQYTLLAAKRVGRTGRVFAIEPNPDNIARLKRNVELNRLKNVSILPIALSDREGQGTFYVPDASDSSPLGSLVSQPHARAFSVAVQTLDSLGLGRIDLLKLDVEGVEDKVLSGGLAAIEASHPAILFEVFNGALENRHGRVTAPVLERLYELRYRLFGIAASGRFHELGPGDDPTPFREPWHALNLLALHPGSETEPDAPAQTLAGLPKAVA